MAALLTADDFLNQMIVQARLLDPSISGAVGTPEYKIFSSVAQELAASQVDMTGLTNALNISSKVGSSLDQFISNFGMQRQVATGGQGYVVFTRPTAAPSNIAIQQGQVIQANGLNTNSPTTVQYATSAAGTIAQGQTASGPVPVQAISAGSATNIPAGALNQFVGTIPAGVSAVSNPVAITNASDPESDDIFKARFQNTWARNLSGTTSSYLAVALAGAFTTKAVCIGQQSTFIEYIQIPDADDAGYVNGAAVSVDGISSATTSVSVGSGLWTTALSDIPFAKNIFTTVPTFISDNGIGSYYYQEGVDYDFNVPPVLQGDALREVVTTAPGTGNVSYITSGTDILASSTIGFPEAGTLLILGSDNNWYNVTYTGIGFNTVEDFPQFTGITVNTASSGSVTTVYGNPIYLLQSGVSTQPNFTFNNVSTVIDQATGQYSTLFDVTTGTYVTNSATVDPTDTLIPVQALTPGQVVQSEFRYVSSASRNDISVNINNCIDVYVNGSNPQQTSCVFLPPSGSFNSVIPQFSSVPSSPFYIENFRRDGEPTRRPNNMNIWTPLFNPPITSLPDTITGPDGATFFLGVHYWLVHEISPLVNSVRGRDGIEWSYQLWGDSLTTAPTPQQGYLPAGSTSSTIMNYGQLRLPVTVSGCSNDANIINMQATYDAQSPATTDVLAHGAKLRYFKFDLTLMYSSNAAQAAVQSAIASSIQNYLDNQYFGSVIQLSSIIGQAAGVSGVQNVRWTNDLPTPPNQIRAIETDVNGNPLAGASTDRYTPYTSSTNATFTLEINGSDFGPNDGFILTWNDPNVGGGFTATTALIPYSDTPGQIATAIYNAISSGPSPYNNGVTISVLYQSPDQQYTQYLVRYATGYTSGIPQPVLPTVVNSLSQGSYLYNEDFFLMDDELPALPSGQVTGDTLPGLIARTRAENTFYRPGVG